MFTMIGIIVMVVGALSFGLYSGARGRKYISESEKEIDLDITLPLPKIHSSKKK